MEFPVGWYRDWETPAEKAASWPDTDAHVRKRGEQTGLDTLVVHAVNYDYSFSALKELVSKRKR